MTALIWAKMPPRKYFDNTAFWSKSSLSAYAFCSYAGHALDYAAGVEMPRPIETEPSSISDIEQQSFSATCGRKSSAQARLRFDRHLRTVLRIQFLHNIADVNFDGAFGTCSTRRLLPYSTCLSGSPE